MFVDEEDQTLCKEKGCSGGLNADPTKPEAGIYFSGITPSKLGWYVDISPEMSEPLQNADGSFSYDISVDITNVITREVAKKYTWYIVGGQAGTYHSYLNLFAPAGGTISNFYVSTFKGNPFSKSDAFEYSGLEAYCLNMYVHPKQTINVSYTVTTSPEALEPLKFSLTPTLSEYRD